jgi:outer membrane protein assembly factor BamB
MNKLKYIIVVILIGICFIAWWLLRPHLDEEKVVAEHEMLIISSYGKIQSVNLEQNKIQWQYQSKYNLGGNRNFFSLSEDILLQPFESGELIAFNLNAGSILWQEHILGGGDGIEDAGATDDGFDLDFINSLKPLFMTQPLITKSNVYITSTNQPMSTKTPALYNFNKKTGEKIWVEALPTVFNFFKPVEINNFIFVNSAVFLNMYDEINGAKAGYGLFSGSTENKDSEPDQFSNPIYVQMLSDGKYLFIGDENGKFYALKFDSKNRLPSADESNPANTFTKNTALFQWIFSDPTISSINTDSHTH